MTFRLRSLTALVALVALMAYFAGSAAAVVLCAQPEAAAQLAAPEGHAAHAPADAGSTGSSDTEHDTHCPLGMIGSSSCAAASLPAPAASMSVVPATGETSWIAPPTRHDPAAPHSLFHPPRA